MTYWEGFMNWPLDVEWVCEICGEYKGMTWGLVNGTCRCNQCHARYRMKDKDDNVVAVPIPMTKGAFKQAAIDGWGKWKKSLDAFTDDEWRELGAPL